MGVTWFVHFSFLSGRFLLGIGSIVGLGQLKNFVYILVVVGFLSFGWKGPSIERTVDFG